MGRPTHDMSDDEFEFDDEYFARTYRPLSNLPTPPLSTSSTSAVQSPQPGVDDGETLESEFLGPAVHLANMLPPAASLATPSVALVQAILSRAQLPLDTIALAVCILDSLDSRFARSWRLSCPLAGLELCSASSPAKRHTLPAAAGPAAALTAVGQLHIDAVCPEVIVVAALMLATKFTEDRQDPTQYYSWAWGRNTWSCEQLNFTERCIMENLNYRILPLMDRDVLEDALVDMARAGRNADRERQRAAREEEEAEAKLHHQHHHHLRAMSTGVAVTGLGFQLTPIDSPASDDLCDAADLGLETKAAFHQPSVICRECLRLPSDDGRR